MFKTWSILDFQDEDFLFQITDNGSYYKEECIHHTKNRNNQQKIRSLKNVLCICASQHTFQQIHIVDSKQIVLFLFSLQQQYLKQMSSIDFSAFEQDELELPQKVKDFNQKKLPFRFIQDLNIKLQKLQNRDTVEELEMLRLKNFSKSAEIREEKTPPLSKFKSYNEKAFYPRKENQQTEDPEMSQSPLKYTARKKLTIQKKQSDHDPLQGKGVIKLKDGKVIFGTWLNGDLQGDAKIVYPNGDIYCGDIKNNLKHGKGTYKFQNRQKYQGDFNNGHFSGYGVLYDQFGEILYRGIWNNGQLVQNIY